MTRAGLLAQCLPVRAPAAAGESRTLTGFSLPTRGSRRKTAPAHSASRRSASHPRALPQEKAARCRTALMPAQSQTLSPFCSMRAFTLGSSNEPCVVVCMPRADSSQTSLGTLSGVMYMPLAVSYLCMEE